MPLGSSTRPRIEFEEAGRLDCLEWDLIRVPLEDSGEEALLGFQGAQHALLDGAARDQVYHPDRPALAHAMNASDALLEYRRVPGQFQVHDRVGGLEVEAGPAGIGAEEHPARRV